MLTSCGGSPGIDMAVPSSYQSMLNDFDKATFFTLTSGTDKEMGLKPDDFDSLPEFKHADVRIVDKVELTESEARLLIEKFIWALENGEANVGTACFFPHHAIRLEKGERKLDILVCFMCHNYHVYPDGGRNNARLNFSGGIEIAWRDIVARHSLRDVSAES